MKYTLFIFALSIFVVNVFAQKNATSYSSYVHIADSLYQAKNYLQSGINYLEAFKSNGGKGIMTDRYNAACSWALAGVPDSAFFQLERIANRANYTNYGHITNDADLASLHQDKRWQPLLDKIKDNKEKAEVNLNKPLVAALDSIYIEDQKYRQQIDGLMDKYGWDSKEMQDHWKIINEKDAINLTKVKSILDKYGWLGSDVIGIQGNTTLFLVIQHSDLQTQEKYLPMMREAVKNGKAQGSSLALLEDRVALGQGKKQIYGSQIGQHQDSGKYFVSPLEDPDNVDERRASVGLGPLSDYVARWQIRWDVEAYKKELLQQEKNLNK